MIKIQLFGFDDQSNQLVFYTQTNLFMSLYVCHHVVVGSVQGLHLCHALHISAGLH